jgi:hypothetical protein
MAFSTIQHCSIRLHIPLSVETVLPAGLVISIAPDNKSNASLFVLNHQKDYSGKTKS